MKSATIVCHDVSRCRVSYHTNLAYQDQPSDTSCENIEDRKTILTSLLEDSKIPAAGCTPRRSNTYSNNSGSRQGSRKFKEALGVFMARVAKRSQFYKTRMCPWISNQRCARGSLCNYAHSEAELRITPDLSRTRMCPSYLANQKCYDNFCRFAHSFGELRATNAFYKTRICQDWREGLCTAGADCRMAHGEEELRHNPVFEGSNSSECVSKQEDQSQNEESWNPTYRFGSLSYDLECPDDLWNMYEDPFVLTIPKNDDIHNNNVKSRSSKKNLRRVGWMKSNESSVSTSTSLAEDYNATTKVSCGEGCATNCIYDDSLLSENERRIACNDILCPSLDCCVAIGNDGNQISKDSSDSGDSTTELGFTEDFIAAPNIFFPPEVVVDDSIADSPHHDNQQQQQPSSNYTNSFHHNHLFSTYYLPNNGLSPSHLLGATVNVHTDNTTTTDNHPYDAINKLENSNNENINANSTAWILYNPNNPNNEASCSSTVANLWPVMSSHINHPAHRLSDAAEQQGQYPAIYSGGPLYCIAAIPTVDLLGYQPAHYTE